MTGTGAVLLGVVIVGVGLDGCLTEMGRMPSEAPPPQPTQAATTIATTLDFTPLSVRRADRLSCYTGHGRVPFPRDAVTIAAAAGGEVVSMGDGDRAVWLLARPGDLPAHLLERGTPLVLVQVDKAELPSLTAGTGPPADPAGRLRRLLASGAGRRELSRDLQVSLRTVDRMIADVRRETGAATTAEAAARLRAMGW